MRRVRIWGESTVLLVVIALVSALALRPPTEPWGPSCAEEALACLPGHVNAVAVLRRPLHGFAAAARQQGANRSLGIMLVPICIPLAGNVMRFPELERHVTTIVEGVVVLPFRGERGYFGRWCCVVLTDADVPEETLRRGFDDCLHTSATLQSWHVCRLRQGTYLVANDEELHRQTLARIQSATRGPMPGVTNHGLAIHRDTIFWAVSAKEEDVAACHMDESGSLVLQWTASAPPQSTGWDAWARALRQQGSECVVDTGNGRITVTVPPGRLDTAPAETFQIVFGLVGPRFGFLLGPE